MTARAARTIAECRLIATMTEEPGRITRRFLTPPMHAVHAHLRKHMEALGMSVHIDAAGNQRGLWQPPTAGPRRLILGSHIDTVPDAGAFDGVLGVTIALEWVALAQELALPLAIEVIAFSEEEGVRYAVPFLGSRAVAGTFNQDMFAYEDADGIRMDDAIRAFGLDPSKIGEAALDENVLGFVEIHIEQGPVLEKENLPLAVVGEIIGQTRLGLRFTGQANHAGTTPMHLRRDALAAAAEWICAVETQIKKAAAAGWIPALEPRVKRVAEEQNPSRMEPGLVATVGKIQIEPNAGNVIPGVVSVSLDLRAVSNRSRGRWVTELIRDATEIARRRGIEFEWIKKMDERRVDMDKHLSLDLKLAVEAAGFPVKTMPSGAGHDAIVMAGRLPTAMLFLRSPGGISHHPDESVLEQDVEASLLVARHFLQRLARNIG
jgi:allantoate deiminase